MKTVTLSCVVLWWAVVAAASDTLSDAVGPVQRDPFALPAVVTQGGPPLGPLRRHSLADLRLVATVHGIEPPRALIEDPGGLGFVIAAGCIVGAEGGKVAGIDPGRVVVELTVPGTARVVLRIDRQADESSDSR